MPAVVRVLIIDDDRDDARLVVDLLGDSKRTQFVADIATTGEEAAQKARKNTYDVLLVDYKLPDTSGIELLARLRERHLRTPAVLITSHGDKRLQIEALDAGFADFLEKGTFNSEILERASLYAIGLYEQQQDRGGSLGMFLQEMLHLTRESVTAQTRTASEMSELRKDLKADVDDLKGTITGLKEHADAQKSELLAELKKGPWERGKEALAWIVAHPLAALLIVLVLVLLVTMAVLLLNVLDASKLQELRKGVSSLVNVGRVRT